jgi:hypothetical protein
MLAARSRGTEGQQMLGKVTQAITEAVDASASLVVPGMEQAGNCQNHVVTKRLAN